MRKILLSAFACDPSKGSEFGNGWNWALGLSQKNFEVHCLTRGINRESVEMNSREQNLHFHYISLPLGLESLYSLSQPTMYLYYLLWQWLAYRKSRKLHRQLKFDIVHHVTWGSLQLGSFLYKLKVPFVFGPVGGGQKAPNAFKKYFKAYWTAELRREKTSKILLRINPGFKKTLRKAHAVLVSNTETLELAKKAGAKNCFYSLDTALPEDFFPEQFQPKQPEPGNLKLLWVGRFFPRKGVLLLLDVMKELKEYPGITLTLVGDGLMKKDIVIAINEDGLNDKVKLIGKVPFEETREHYLSHDVFFFTSLRDSCPAQLFESMAFGLPVVTLKLHGQALIVNDNTGFRCDCETPEIAIEELKKAIIYLYKNPDEVNEMSQAAFEFAKNETWTKRINTIAKQCYPN